MLTFLMFVVAGLNALAAFAHPADSARPFALVAALAFGTVAVLRVSRRWWGGAS